MNEKKNLKRVHSLHDRDCSVSFKVLVSHLYIFSELAAHFPVPLFSIVVCLLDVLFFEYLYSLNINPLSDAQLEKCSSDLWDAPSFT